MTSPKMYIGRANVQVDEFLEEHIEPILEQNKELLGVTVELNV